jgi:uncharacterized protein (DUF362 family)
LESRKQQEDYMADFTAGIVRYSERYNSLKEVVEISGAFNGIKPDSKVFIKPNIVVWTQETVFPKWGVITTSRIVEDTVLLLKEHGVSHITIGEGIITMKPNDTETSSHAFESLGYNRLAERHGVKCIDIFSRPFMPIDISDDVKLKVNRDILESDFVIDLPVLKTHAQTVVSLGLKNLKGVLDINSRKKCHSTKPQFDLNRYISRIYKSFPPVINIIDGIYSLEWGPTFDGRAKRSDILIASPDLLSGDLVGARLLGYKAEDIKYLKYALEDAGRPADLSDIQIRGEQIDELVSLHRYDFPYNEDGTLPVKMDKMGIKGLSYRKYDNTMCTYCSGITGAVITAIALAWKGEPWDNVEVLTGKSMKPEPGKKTILLGQCMVNENKDYQDALELIKVRGCPPRISEVITALQAAGINVNPDLLNNVEKAWGFFMARYAEKSEFSESFFSVE